MQASAPEKVVTVVAHEVHAQGGMERAQAEVILGLLDRGWTVQVVARVCDLDPHPRLTWRRVRTPRRPFAIAYPLFAVVAMVVLALRRRGVVSALGAIVPNRVDVVVVQFCHHGFRAAETARASRDTLPRRLNDALGRRLALGFERWCYRAGRVRRFIAVSDLIRTELETHFGHAARSVDVVPNGVDVERFRPDPQRRMAFRSEHGLAQDARVALFAGGDWERKGLGVALQGCAGTGWSLLVVGEGDEGDYLREASRLRVPALFTGRVADPSSAFAAADAFVLPSAYEGFALVTIEAAASGLPLVVTEATGAGGLAADGGGLLVGRAAGDIRAALIALSDDEVRRTAGAVARRAATELTWPRIIDRYEATFARM